MAAEMNRRPTFVGGGNGGADISAGLIDRKLQSW
jgi:hypothetical protein